MATRRIGIALTAAAAMALTGSTAAADISKYSDVRHAPDRLMRDDRSITEALRGLESRNLAEIRTEINTIYRTLVSAELLIVEFMGHDTKEASPTTEKMAFASRLGTFYGELSLNPIKGPNYYFDEKGGIEAVKYTVRVHGDIKYDGVNESLDRYYAVGSGGHRLEYSYRRNQGVLDRPLLEGLVLSAARGQKSEYEYGILFDVNSLAYVNVMSDAGDIRNMFDGDTIDKRVIDDNGLKASDISSVIDVGCINGIKPNYFVDQPADLISRYAVTNTGALLLLREDSYTH